MKVTKHVEHLLRQGKKPHELVELGFPKAIVTRVRRQLREEKASQTMVAPRDKHQDNTILQTSPDLNISGRLMNLKLTTMQLELTSVKRQLEALQKASVALKDMKAQIASTPALGLRQRFKCDCGASGLVAVNVKCTKCGRQVWWGWWPKRMRISSSSSPR